MKKVLGVFLGLIALIIVGIIGVFAFSSTANNPLSTAANDVKLAATNAALDAVDAKGQVKNALNTYRDDIAAATGLSTSQVDAAITKLDIDNWKAASLPKDATETNSISGNYAGIDGSLTTYTDPSYVTVDAYGQAITLEVPESAQEYLSYLALIQ